MRVFDLNIGLHIYIITLHYYLHLYIDGIMFGCHTVFAGLILDVRIFSNVLAITFCIC